MKVLRKGASIKMDDLFLKRIEIDQSLIDKGSYLNNIPALTGTKKLIFSSNITFFAGENGTGKSTLLEAIAVAYGFSAEGGTLNYNFSTYDSHSELYKALKISKGIKRPSFSYFLRAESFYNVATKTEEYRDKPESIYYSKYGGKSFHSQSHGESFFSLIGAFSPNGLYILDEPEAALSPQKQLAVLSEIYTLAQQGAQFIIASHSPILLGIPGAQILSFDGKRIEPCDYTETESYKVTEMFIKNREHLLRYLLEE